MKARKRGEFEGCSALLSLANGVLMEVLTKFVELLDFVGDVINKLLEDVRTHSCSPKATNE